MNKHYGKAIGMTSIFTTCKSIPRCHAYTIARHSAGQILRDRVHAVIFAYDHGLTGPRRPG